MSNGDDFVVIGWLGPTIHGAERATGDVDIMYRVNYRQSRSHVREFEINVASLDDLIAMKRTAARNKGAGKLGELEALRRLQPNESPDGP